MAELSITAAQYSDKGAKTANEDSCGIHVPGGTSLVVKGIAAVIADGVSGSEAGKQASDACVQGFLNDYFSTPESWSVKTSGHKVLTALNRWLHGQSQQLYGSSQAMVTTLSALVIKSATAHLFHAGDTRIYRLRGRDLECLTQDHRIQVAGDKNYLSRALGIELHIDIDYRALAVEEGDVFILTTDGVHDFLAKGDLLTTLQRRPNDLEQSCRELVSLALANGSQDNLTVQIVRVDRLSVQDKADVYRQLTELPFPPSLEPGMILDGYRVLRELHATKRTELYLAADQETGEQVVLKTPSVNFEDDPTYIDRFLHEEWVGMRIDNPHVLKVRERKRQRQFLYYVTEYVEGQTLRQWMHDRPHPSLTEVRNIIDQLAAGLRAFHRMEMIHQDLKPENIMIDKYGSVKIIDFGSTKIAGIEEIASPIKRDVLLGTRNYTAPEYLLGYGGSNRSDIFSLGVIAYEMLTGRLPYGENSSERLMSRRLSYTAATQYNPSFPVWVDGALRKAVHPDPEKRYGALSEFTHDLAQPNPDFTQQRPLPLLERDPTAFWRGLAIFLLLSNIILLFLLTG